ncbi:hypothetical protein JKG47_21725 [Acidithiobacillus sp. MC6.1]|nr:hypothetical protein [Acidithiobacillus sp. MC6.1]
MILAFIVIAMLIGLIAIGNTEFKGTQKFAAPHKTQATASAPPMSSTPSRGAPEFDSSSAKIVNFVTPPQHS